MKTTFLTSFLMIFANLGFGQVLPAKFSWKEVQLNSGVIVDFTRFEVGSHIQLYQGPCQSFALKGALEAMFRIEHNLPNDLIDVSAAYLHFKHPSDHLSTLMPKLNAGVLARQHGAASFPNLDDFRLAGVINEMTFLATDVFIEDDQPVPAYVNKVQNALSYYFSLVPETCFDLGSRIVMVNGDEIKFPEIIPQLCSGYCVSVGQMSQITSLSQMKSMIYQNGPVIVRVKGNTNLTTSNLAKVAAYPGLKPDMFHAFLIIGWQTSQNGDIQWHIKDSWPGFSNYHYSLPNPDFQGLMNSGNMEIYMLKKVKRTDANPPEVRPDYLSKIKVSMIDIQGNLFPGQYCTLIANMDCSFFGNAKDWEWVVTNSASRSVTKGTCLSSILVKPINSTQNLVAKVRVKSQTDVWSEWYSVSLAVEHD